MDPMSIITVVGFTLQVTKVVFDGAQWMCKVYETVTKGDKTLRLIALECKIYGESIKAIGHWLRQNKNAKGLMRQFRTTHNAITLVQVSMVNLSLDLEQFRNNGGQTAVKDNKISREKLNVKLLQQFLAKKAKLVWFQKAMGTHLVELRAHAATLQLTLGVIELTRTHTPEQKEEVPGKLEEKTGKLEKRLFLRQVIAKALEIRRKEIAEAAAGIGDGGSEQMSLVDFQGAVQDAPHKLTFYDVVQLARQQALMEKTRTAGTASGSGNALGTLSPSEDLIDFSDASQPTQNPLRAILDLDLLELDSSNPVALQSTAFPFPSQNEAWETKHYDTAELPSNESAVAEMGASASPKESVSDLLNLVESQKSETNGIHEMEACTPMKAGKTSIKLDPTVAFPKDALQDSTAVDPTDSLARDNMGQLDKVHILQAMSELPDAPLQQAKTIPTGERHNTAEALTDESPTSTAAPSVFSHATSRTSTTASSLPGITEEEVAARTASLDTSLEFSSKIPRLGPGPVTNPDLVSSSKSQLTKSEDSVSLSQPLQQIPDTIDEPDQQGFPWIVQAARDGDEQTVRKLLVSGADITAVQTSSRRHALSEASIRGHQAIVDLLVQEGGPLELRDAEGNTALHHACRSGHLGVAKSLITNSALINASGPQGQTALHLAMLAPHQNLVMLLVQLKANVNARDALSRTPLHIGASQGNIAMCSYLLDEGAQLDSREAQSKTPLQLACEVNHTQLVQMMLQKSTLTPSNTTFLTAFFAAVEHGHVQIAESFFASGLKLQELKKHTDKPITLAAKSGCHDMVELVIHENCDVNARDSNGWNALHFASFHGQYQVVDPLLEGGVAAKATTSRKETPLLIAVQRGHFAVAERLLRSQTGSDLVSAEDEYGQQPVHHAVRAGSIEIFNLLMSYGGIINAQNDFGWQPLHIATAYCHLALVERLLQQGANIEEKLGSSTIKKEKTHKIVEEGYWAEARWPYPGSRALHLACEYAHDEIGRYLVSRGAKRETSCNEGWQPLHHASYFGRSDLVALLLEGGVNPHTTINEGKTALALGYCTSGAPISEGDKERTKLLLKEAMDKTRKQKSLKVALKRGSTVEEKNRLIRQATFSLDMVSKPPLHRATTTAQAPDPASTHPELMLSSPRPRFPHLSHTSPLPATEFPFQSRPSTILPPTSLQAVPQSEPRQRAASITADSILESAEELPSRALAVVSTTKSSTNRPTSFDATSASNLSLTPTVLTDLTPAPEPKLKRRTTFGLGKSKQSTDVSKPKPSMDIGKLSLGNIGKPAFDIGKSTVELGSKTLGYGKQGIEISKQRFEALQGLEMGKQGREIGKQSMQKSKQGYENVKKLARRGKKGDKGMPSSGKELTEATKGDDGTVEKGNKSRTGENKCDDVDSDASDDAGSQFSLGGFAEEGRHDF